MATRLREVGKKVSAANATKIRTAVTALADILSLLDSPAAAAGDEVVAAAKEAAIVLEAAAAPEAKEDLSDVRAALQKLLDFLPPEAKEDLEGSDTGDDPGTAIVQGKVGEALREGARHAVAELLISLGEAGASAGMVCASCNTPVKSSYSSFCGGCGKSLKAGGGAGHCAGCGYSLDSSDKFCTSCGTSTPSTAPTKESAATAAVQHGAAFGNMAPAAQTAHLVNDHGAEKGSAKLKIPSVRFGLHGDAHSHVADTTEESATFEISNEFFRISEKAIGRDGGAKVKIIAPGWGSSGHYSAEVLERDIPLAFPKGTKMFWDHPTRTEEADRPERSLKDLAAVIETTPKYEANGPEGPGAYANVQVFKPFQPIVEELAPHIGISIRGSGQGKQGTVEGKTGKIIERIVSGQSADFVTEPGAGGKITSLFESARGSAPIPLPTNSPSEDDVDMDKLQEATSKLSEAQDQIARLRERVFERDAQDFLAKEINKYDLKPPAKRRLVEAMSADPPIDDTDEDNPKINEKALGKNLKEAVDREITYLADLGLGDGKVRGLSESRRTDDDDLDGAPDEKEDRLMVATFGRLGLTESQSKIAANGRRR